MTVYIGQASCDENGRYVGGQAGNQSGTELNIRAYYNKPWDRGLIRFKNPAMARACAEAMRGAVSNMNIGYDQNERNTILPAAKAVGLLLSAIAKACECDCSSLAGMCGIAAGISEGAIYQGGNLTWTGNIIERFRATGQVEIYDASYAAKSSNLQNGDILVASSHAVVVVSGAKDPSGENVGGSAASNFSSIDELARAVIAGRYGNGDTRREALGAKYDAVQKRVNELLNGTSNAAGTSTGDARIIAGTYKVVANSLNVRSKPSLNGKKLALYNYGEYIYNVQPDIIQADGYTWAHYVAYGGATRYVAICPISGTEKYLVKC